MCRTLFRKHDMMFRCLRSISTIAKQTPAEYCMELVRKSDYENYLCTILLPTHVRAAGFVIRAFNVEVAQVQDQVTNNNIGVMRMKFWSDALNNVYNNTPPKTPVALELHRILKRYSLSKYYFKRLIDARAERLNNSEFLDINAIEQYSENTVSPIYYLLLEAQEIKDINTDHLASHLGKAHGIVTLIRSIPYNAQKRINVLPQDVLMEHNVSTEAVLQKRISKDLNDAVFEVASHAKQHLDIVISLRKKINQKASAIFLPSVCVEIYLEELRRANFNVFDPKLHKRNNLLPLKLWWRNMLL